VERTIQASALAGGVCGTWDVLECERGIDMRPLDVKFGALMNWTVGEEENDSKGDARYYDSDFALVELSEDVSFPEV